METLTGLETELRKIELMINEIYEGTRSSKEMDVLEHKATCLELEISNLHKSYIDPAYTSMTL